MLSEEKIMKLKMTERAASLLIIGKLNEYLKKYPYKEKFLFFKIHTNQNLAMILRRDLREKLLVRPDLRQPIGNKLHTIFDNFVKDKTGELSDMLSKALLGIIDTSQYTAEVDRMYTYVPLCGMASKNHIIENIMLEKLFSDELPACHTNKYV